MVSHCFKIANTVPLLFWICYIIFSNYNKKHLNSFHFFLPPFKRRLKTISKFLNLQIPWVAQQDIKEHFCFWNLILLQPETMAILLKSWALKNYIKGYRQNLKNMLNEPKTDVTSYSWMESIIPLQSHSVMECYRPSQCKDSSTNSSYQERSFSE